MNDIRNNSQLGTIQRIAAKNTVILPHFLEWKFFEKSQFPRKPCGKCVFSQNFHTRILGDMTVYFTIYHF